MAQQKTFTSESQYH